MPQNRETGRAAMLFGHEMAKKVAEYLRAQLVPGPSNNAIWNNKKINIKSAKLGNTKIGATLNNLAWADSIIAAIQKDKTYFTLYEVTSNWLRNEMRPSRQPHTMMVDCVKISRYGIRIGDMPA